MVVRKRRSTSALALSVATLITLAALPLSGLVFAQGARPQS
jgi:hypothetical protein